MKHGQLRIFMNSRYRLICLDAKTGALVDTFGAEGIVDLTAGLSWKVNPRHYTNTSPPVVYRNLVILGNGVGDRLTYRNDPPGDVRAFDARTGKLVWTFRPIPRPGEFGNETWGEGSWQFTGHTNVWAPMSLDEARGLLYLPVSTPSNDYYGARRPGANLFAESIVCLDASTGTRKWHYQIVHHGLWDYDLPAAPILVSITVAGRRIDAVVQLTKQGFAFVFDRVTGEPVWPIEERSVPASDVPGEQAWKTQPFPTQAARLRRTGRVARRRVRLDAGAARAGAGRAVEVPARPALHAAVAAGNGHAARRDRRRQLGRRRVRSRDRLALRQELVEHAAILRLGRAGSLAGQPARGRSGRHADQSRAAARRSWTACRC